LKIHPLGLVVSLGRQCGILRLSQVVVDREGG
jgi:hypothetical protein